MQAFADRTAPPLASLRPRAHGRVRTRRSARAVPGSEPAQRHLAVMLERCAFALHGCATDDAGTRIDHLAVGPSGVWVVASRRVALERIQLRRSLRAAPALRVGGVDRPELLELLDRQRLLVCSVLADQPHVPVHTALCFAGGEFPLLGSLSSGGHHILPPAELAARVGAAGPLRRSESRFVAQLLDERLGD